MRVGEIIPAGGTIELNQGRNIASIMVVNIGDRPVQVGSHYHFFEVNRLLRFDRKTAFGMRLDIPSGTSVRFEPGEEKEVALVSIGGTKRVCGFNSLTCGQASECNMKYALLRAELKGFMEKSCSREG